MDKIALIVEDDPATAALISKVVARYGLQAEVYEDALPTISRLLAKDKAKVELVITDIYLKNSNGLSVLEAMALSPRLQKIPRIAISSHFNSVSMATLTSFDCTEVCFKPLNVQELGTKIATSMGHPAAGDKKASKAGDA